MARTAESKSQATSAKRRAREYETIYILRSSVTPEEAERVSNRFTDIVGSLGGKLVKVDNWGWRRLAYAIKGETRGVFIYFKYLGYDDVVAELERNLRLADSVVRFQTILLQPRVEMEKIEVDPAATKLAPIVPGEGADEDITIAQRLGLVERQAPPRVEAEPSAQEPVAAAEAETAGDDEAGESDAGEGESPEEKA